MLHKNVQTKKHMFWSIINKKNTSEHEFCPISIGVLQLDNNTSKETKGLFRPCTLFHCPYRHTYCQTKHTCRNINK
jgi:hypothetical protein